MKKTDFLNNLSARLSNTLPPNIKHLKEDMKKNFQAVLQKIFTEFELVTKEEFDIQTKVLARTRKKLEALEKTLKELEESLGKKTK